MTSGSAVHQRRRGRTEHGLRRRGSGSCRTPPLGLQYRPLPLRAALRADPQRRLPARLPVVLVGNGGGYGYGVMGATHHALEDYGALLCLPNLRAYVPAFDSDVRAMVEPLMTASHPAYLRLGLSEEPSGVAVPLMRRGESWWTAGAGLCWSPARWLAASGRPSGSSTRRRPTLWLVTELPLGAPAAIPGRPRSLAALLVVEEHVAQGGAGQMIARPCCSAATARAVRFAVAPGLCPGRYGSQKFHRRECGLDPASIVRFPRPPRTPRCR